jgi:hypothetical protein
VQISRPDENSVLLSHLDALVSELLRRIPASADPTGSESARARLFSLPTQDEAEQELVEDWREYVEPELARLFLSTIEVIKRDLEQLHVDEMTGEAILSISKSDLESWIHGLNQARLALAARHAFTDEELEQKLPLTGDSRALALLQIGFYALLQDLFLRELEDD